MTVLNGLLRGQLGGQIIGGLFWPKPSSLRLASLQLNTAISAEKEPDLGRPDFLPVVGDGVAASEHVKKHQSGLLTRPATACKHERQRRRRRLTGAQTQRAAQEARWPQDHFISCIMQASLSLNLSLSIFIQLFLLLLFFLSVCDSARCQLGKRADQKCLCCFPSK